jgi:DNA-binding XRE family transcriptional regulator
MVIRTARPSHSELPYNNIGTIVPGNIVPSVFAISSMDLKKTMATNVRRTRHARKMTQEELADRAGLSARYLGSIERASVSASVTVLGRLAQALVSVREQFEFLESVVIQEWWPDSRRVTNVDGEEPRTLRPQQVAIPE